MSARLYTVIYVFCDDFATVDFCEPRATIASTDQAYNFTGKRNKISLYK